MFPPKLPVTSTIPLTTCKLPSWTLLLALSLALAIAGCGGGGGSSVTSTSSSTSNSDSGGTDSDDGGTVTQTLPYAIVDTGQAVTYDDEGREVTAPQAGQDFYGQDAQYTGNQPTYTLSTDGLTAYGDVTELTWQRSADSNRDGDVDYDDKFTFAQAQAHPDTLNAQEYGGFSDWRLPSIKELYSLILFSGKDVSGWNGTDTSGLVPFIDTDTFDFGYGDTGAWERVIDAQYWSATAYVSTTMGGAATAFGVNFADGRIKGYPQTKAEYVICVRGNTSYGTNSFTDNGDGTITDQATGLTWQQTDDGTARNWEEALAYAEGLELAGHSDWRLPNAKELQSIIDYTRSPLTTGSAAIDPVFSCTAITDEAGGTNYPFYWTSTTHANWTATPGRWAAYLAFGEALGFMWGQWLDVHGAGAQRSDPKYDDGTDYSSGHGPQGDAVRINNYVRCVRGGLL